MALLDFLTAYTDVASLAVRIAVGVLMMIHGLPKLAGPARSQMRGMMQQLGIPGGLFDLVAILEFLGGLFLLLGLLTRIVSILFILEMIGTTLLYLTKLGKKVPPPEMLTQMVQASRNFMRGYMAGVSGWELDTVILAAAIATLILGGGAFSIDALIGL
ncbi:MAG: DoxX family protein [Aigarchaeota archaeon]|nr:DoxX family protein [Candidatus Pelearchaeum maunauluense]